MRVVTHQNMLPREVVDAASIEAFKTRLGMALSSLLQLQMSLLTAWWLDSMTSKSLIQLKPFDDSVIHQTYLWLVFCHVRTTFPQSAHLMSRHYGSDTDRWHGLKVLFLSIHSPTFSRLCYPYHMYATRYICTFFFLGTNTWFQGD